MEFPNVSKLQHFLSCSVIGQYFNADSSLAGNLIQKLHIFGKSLPILCENDEHLSQHKICIQTYHTSCEIRGDVRKQQTLTTFTRDD